MLSLAAELSLVLWAGTVTSELHLALSGYERGIVNVL